MAHDLKAGETLRLLDGPTTVESVESGPVQPVFNLDVADAHDFFAGSAAALVHDNTLPDTRLQPFDADADVFRRIVREDRGEFPIISRGRSGVSASRPLSVGWRGERLAVRVSGLVLVVVAVAVAILLVPRGIHVVVGHRANRHRGGVAKIDTMTAVTVGHRFIRATVGAGIFATLERHLNVVADFELVERRRHPLTRRVRIRVGIGVCIRI